MTRNQWIITAAAALTIVGVASAQFNPQPDPPAFSPFGIVSGQTARLAAWCSPTLAAAMTAVSSCTVEFEFEDMSGHTIRTETQTIAAGHGGFLDLPMPPAERPARSEIIPCIKVHGRGVAVSASLEVFDPATGRTAFHADGLAPVAHLLIGLL